MSVEIYTLKNVLKLTKINNYYFDMIYIFQYIAACIPVIGNDHERSSYIIAITKNRGPVFSVQSVPRCYNQDSESVDSFCS